MLSEDLLYSFLLGGSIVEWFSNFRVHQSPPVVVSGRLLLPPHSPPPRVSDQEVWVGVREFAFLTSTLLLAQGLYIENYCSSVLEGTEALELNRAGFKSNYGT